MVLKETYRLLKKHAGTYFVIFVLEVVFFAVLTASTFVAVKFPEIRNSFENRFTAKVFINKDATEKEIRKFFARLKNDEKIEAKLIDPEQAAEIFAEKLNMKTKNLLSEISFPFSVTIRFKRGFSYSEILSYLKKLQNEKIVESVRYPKKTAYVISKHLLLVSVAFAAFIAVLLWGLFIIIRQFANKIIEMTREESNIKALIGVKPFSIRFPFTLADGIVTLFAAAVSISVYSAVMYITDNNILFEKSLFFPIIITLIFAVVLIRKQSVTIT